MDKEIENMLKVAEAKGFERGVLVGFLTILKDLEENNESFITVKNLKTLFEVIKAKFNQNNI